MRATTRRPLSSKRPTQVTYPPSVRTMQPGQTLSHWLRILHISDLHERAASWRRFIILSSFLASKIHDEPISEPETSNYLLHFALSESFSVLACKSVQIQAGRHSLLRAIAKYQPLMCAWRSASTSSRYSRAKSICNSTHIGKWSDI